MRRLRFYKMIKVPKSQKNKSGKQGKLISTNWVYCEKCKIPKKIKIL